MSVRFNSKALASEIRSFGGLSKGYWEVTTEAWDVLAREVKRIGVTSSATPLRWEVPCDAPLVTRASRDYDRSPGREVRGVMSFVWELQRSQKDVVEVVGLASTKVVFRDEEDGKEIVAWDFDIGSPGSPGACFHAQVVPEQTHPAYSSPLSVPRLHSLVTTPVDAADFVLCELFQEEWKAKTAMLSADQQNVRKYQQGRLRSLLEWKRSMVAGAEGGSVWAALKRAYPSGDEFL